MAVDSNPVLKGNGMELDTGTKEALESFRKTLKPKTNTPCWLCGNLQDHCDCPKCAVCEFRCLDHASNELVVQAEIKWQSLYEFCGEEIQRRSEKLMARCPSCKTDYPRDLHTGSNYCFDCEREF